jgi:hypothetical protein
MVSAAVLEPAKGQAAPKIQLAHVLGGITEDITPGVAAFSVYSSIEHPFMSMNCMFMDEFGFIRRNNVNGDMSIVASMTDGGGRKVSGKFHINSMKTYTTNGRRALGVEFIGMTAEHLNNAAQKVTEWKYKHNADTLTTMIKFINDKYLKGQLDVNVSSFPAVNIDIVNQTPLQAISFLLERAAGSGENIFVYFQKFVGENPRFILDEVSRMAQAGAKFRFHMTENNISDEAHIIDEIYVGGGSECRILQFHQDSAFNAHDIIQQGYASKEYIEIDFVNKITKIDRDQEQNVLLGSKQMPEVIEAVKNHASQRATRAIYDTFNGDETYFRPPNLKDAYLKTKVPSSGFLSKRITLSAFGCFNVQPGDCVLLNYKINDADPGRGVDPEYSSKHFVIAAKHSVNTNGECYSQFELAKDGQS